MADRMNYGAGFMTYTGKIQNGVVVLDHGACIEEGAIVQVVLVDPSARGELDGRAKFLALAGCIDDLPPDFARNHDHYLHGHPKQ